jgi:hypothetical protein
MLEFLEAQRHHDAQVAASRWPLEQRDAALEDGPVSLVRKR